MTIRDRIVQAVAATRVAIPGYFEKTLAQRAGLSKTAAGSIYVGVSEPELEQMLLAADWEAYSHAAIMAGCVAFTARMPGQLGIADLATLPADSIVTLDDRKGTGKVSAVVAGIRGEEVAFTVIILGQEAGQEVVFTFHPGDPVRPSEVQATPGLHGRQVTVAEAIGMGLATAKIV